MPSERKTVMVCSNSTGTHQLHFFLIGNAKDRRSFKHVKLPVTFAGQKSAWLTSNIFVRWYKTVYFRSKKVLMFNRKK
jgi:DDE superfamily endonuclease